MKVKLKSKAKQPALTVGNVYRVIGIEADYLRIMNDHGQPVLYPPTLFRVLDPAPGLNWQWHTGDDDEKYAYPPELAAPGFFEDYFDGKKKARATLQSYLLRLDARSGDQRRHARGRHSQAA